MSERDLDLVRRAAPPATPPSPEVVDELRARLVARIDAAGPAAESASLSRPGRQRSFVIPALTGATALVAGVAVVAIAAGGGGADTAGSAGGDPTAPLTQQTTGTETAVGQRESPDPVNTPATVDGAPGLLLSDPAWPVTRIDVYGDRSGEMSFTNGVTLELRWTPASAHAGLVRDRASGTTKSDLRVLGEPAVLFSGRGQEPTIVWSTGPYTLEARALGFTDVRALTRLVDLLKPVSAERFRAALPQSAITPATRPAVVREMLKGLPLPPGFDAAALERQGVVKDRYQLGAQVAGAVACGWIGLWATANSDTARRRAVEAMATSRDWAVLQEMNAAGDYPEAVWEYADAIAGDGTVVGGKVVSVAESYVDALGCSAPKSGAGDTPPSSSASASPIPEGTAGG